MCDYFEYGYGGEEVLELVLGEVAIGDVSSAEQYHCSP